MAISNAGTIDPSKFAADKQQAARLAKNADEAHTARIKGTSNKDEIKGSFRESINSWKQDLKDTFKLQGFQQSPDGGMRELARRRGLG